MWRPWRSENASIIARGGAAPPTVMNRIAEMSYAPGFASSAWRIPIQIVGTPAVIVTFSCWKPVEQAHRIQVRPGEDLLDARHRGGEREAPRVRVEHRHDREADVVGVMPRDAITVSAWIAIARCE